MAKEIVRFDTGNTGTEVWLVDNAADVQAAWGAAEAAGLIGEECPLNQAADAARGLVALASYGNNDIPADTDEDWLSDLLADTAAADRAEVAEIVREAWAA